MTINEYEEFVEELNEKILHLEYEVSEKTSEILSLKKEKERLYNDVKEARYQAALFRTEMQNSSGIYEEELERRIKEKNALQEQLDLVAIKVKRYDELEKTVSEIKIKANQEAVKLMDEAEEKSMDAVTVIEFILKDIGRMKFDLENLSRNSSAGKSDLQEEIALMIDLLNNHLEYLKKIKSGFYKMNNITEYENTPEDFSLAHRVPKIKEGNYVD